MTPVKLSGISDVLSAMNEPERYSQGWLKRMAGAVVPTGVAQVARTVDPTLREAKTILDAVPARVPYASKSLQPRRDVWGGADHKRKWDWSYILFPVWLSMRKNDPVNNALMEAGAGFGQPNRTVGGERLNALEWGRYRATAGAIGRNALADLVASQEWRTIPRDDQQDAVKYIMRDARKEARGLLIESRQISHRQSGWLKSGPSLSPPLLGHGRKVLSSSQYLQPKLRRIEAE